MEPVFNMRIKSLIDSLARRSLPVLAVMAVALTASHAQHSFIPNGDLQLPPGAGELPEKWSLIVPFTGSRVPREGKPGEYALQLKAGAEEERVFWLSQAFDLEPDRNYVLSYSAKAPGGQKYRAYVEYWESDKSECFSSGAQWKEGSGEWETHQITFHYSSNKTKPFLALEVHRPGEVVFADISVTEAED